jgi:mannose-6-phosphate isomerase-like protein (cupin superfamily)
MAGKVNLGEKPAPIHDCWNEVKLVKFAGEFIWRSHEHEDERFLALRGRFRVESRDRTV